MKKLLKFMLVLSLLVPTYVFVSYASNESSIMAKTMGDYTYDVASDDTITIVNYNGSENEVIIPSEIDGKKVKKIGYAAFAECKSIESLTIPTSVTIIDSYAFSQCSQLKEINIPDSVVSLGRYAFGACISLEEVVLPNKIKGLGYGTFFDCIALKNVVFPEGLKSIGESTFGNCKSLVEINFPTSLTSIEGNAFTNCISLQTLDLPEGLNFIGSGVFSGCLALEQVNLPESLSGIGQSAFQDCVSLESIVIPNTVSGIGYSAFSGCTNLKEINIPSALSYLGNALFSGCSSLESMVIPSTIEEIGNNVFSGCTNLKEVIIPNSVTSIGDEAFSYCSSLTSMTLPKNIETIPASLFRYCSSLESIVIPTGVKEIKSTAFADCSSLISVTIPSSTSIFGSRVFSNSPLAVVSVASESAAYKYAVNNKIKYRIFTTGINLDKTQLQLKVGQSSAFAVIMSPYTIIDNKQVTWTSNNANVATVDAQGVVIGVNTGEAIITAQSGNGQKASATVTVDNNEVTIEQIMLSKTQMTMKKGTSEGLKATINPTNTTMDKTLSWQSSNDQVVSVSSTGSLTARAPGEATITVTTTNGKQASCQITVISEIKSISLNQTSLVVEEGTKHSLRASINPIDTTDSKEITWVSSNTNVATVDAQGMVTTVAEGTVTISAVSVNNKRAECKIRVMKAEVSVPITSVTLNKTSLTLTEGDKETIEATINPTNTTDDKTLTWTTSDAKIATVKDGEVVAVKEGKATITVRTSNGKTNTCVVDVKKKEVPITSVTLNKTSLTLTEGDKETIEATINPTNTTDDKTLTWTTSDAKVATVKDGEVVAVKEGKATITVRTSNGKTSTCVVDVKKKEVPITSVTLNKTSLTLTEGDKETIEATINPTNTTDDKTLTWTTSDAKVATVKDGEVVAVKEGKATITVRTSNGKTSTCVVDVKKKEVPITSVTLNKTSLTLTEGDKETIEATINPTNTTDDKTLTWTTSDAKVATVKDGEVVAVKEGKATITVRTSNGKTSTCVVNVERKPVPIEKIELNKTSLELKLGKSDTLIATITPNDTTESKELSWTSNKESVASVKDGLITTHSAGEATIKVTTKNGLSATCTVLVYEVDKTTLLTAIQKVEVMDSSQYTQSSWDKLLIATNEAKNIYENEEVRQQEVDAAVEKVNGAIAKLVVRATDSAIETLRALVEECKGFADQFTEAEFASMQQKIVEVEAMLAKQPTEISQAEVDNVKVLLANEKQKLIIIGSQNTLKEAIVTANEILAGDTTGINEEIIAEMRKEVANGEALIASDSNDIDTMNTVTKKLQELIGLAQHVVDKSMLNDLVELGKGFDKSLYTVDSWGKFESQLTLSQSMLEDAKVTQNEVNDQYQNLANALLGLKVKVDVSILTGNIEDIQMILDHANKYIASSIKGLDVLVEEAKKVLEKENVTSEEVKDMNKRLMKAKLQARLKGN